MKTLRYDPKSIRSGLTLVTLLCWILPILIIVTMFSVLVNYYNDRNLEQAMDLGMENAMQQVELRLLSVIEDSRLSPTMESSGKATANRVRSSIRT